MSVRQGPEIDRWLMRAKDIIQIVLAISSAIYVGYQFVEKVNRMNDTMLQIRNEVVDLRKEFRDHIGRK